MLVVILDANAIANGARLRSSDWEQLSVAVIAGTARVSRQNELATAIA
jgi:hypothetical protein